MTELEQKQKELRNKEWQTQTRAFAVVLEIVVIFGVPAILVALSYNWLAFSRSILYSLLVFTFILSWFIVIMRVRQIKRGLTKIRKEREALGPIDTTQVRTYEDEIEA